jgi:hypothetical protein
MTASMPAAEKNLDGYGQPPLKWERVIASLDKTRGMDVQDKAGSYWLATTRPDGRAHVMPLGVVWDTGTF